jgi:uncharacterized protein (TIGR03437 family)
VGLATGIQAAVTLPLPTTLAGTTVKMRDSSGTERLAGLFFVAPTQVNYQIPAGTRAGIVTVTITAGDGTVSMATEYVTSIAPGLFTANANGSGVPAAYAIRVRNGAQTNLSVASFDAARNQFAAVPLDLGEPDDQVVLVLYGTGLRKRSEDANVRALIGQNHVVASYAGEAPGFVGLDQINLLLPRVLMGRGEIEVRLTADSQSANPVVIAVK